MKFNFIFLMIQFGIGLSASDFQNTEFHTTRMGKSCE